MVGGNKQGGRQGIYLTDPFILYSSSLFPFISLTLISYVQELKENVDKYAKSVTNLFNNGETKDTMNEYKQSVLKLLKRSGIV